MYDSYKNGPETTFYFHHVENQRFANINSMDKAPSIKWRKCQGDFKGGGSIHLGSGNESSHNQGYIVCQIFKDFYGGPYEWLEVSKSQKIHKY